MFKISNMTPNKFVFLILVCKIKSGGATRSQSCSSNVSFWFVCSELSAKLEQLEIKNLKESRG